MAFKKISLAIVVILACASVSLAQDRKPLSQEEEDLYIVSVQAGVVNLVEGEASLRRGAGGWVGLNAREELRDYDRVRTGAGSRVEILLNPGAYLRLSENAELVVTDTETNRFEVFLSKGSAIVEASLMGSWIGVATPRSDFAIIQGGLYRFNVSEDGSSHVLSRKGRLVIDGSRIDIGGGKYLLGGIKVKDGKQIVVEDKGPYVSPIADKKAQDDFDIWSKERARTIIAANKRLPIKDMLRSIPMGMLSNVWVYDRFSGCYTFLPGFYDLYSPYGYRYRLGAPGSYYPCCNNGSGYGNGGYWGSPGNGGGSSNGGWGGGIGSGSGGSGGGSVALPSRGGGVRSGHAERTTEGRDAARKP